MNNQIEQSLLKLLENTKIDEKKLSDFGSDIAQHLLQSLTLTEEEFKDDINKIYLSLLRKGHIVFNSHDSGYDSFFKHHLIEGIYKGLIINEPLMELIARDFTSKIRGFLPKYQHENSVTVEVATKFANKDIPGLAERLIHFANWHLTKKEQPYTPEDLIKFWNGVYDEFSIQNRLDLIPSLIELTMDKLGPGERSLIHKKAVLQGLNNLKNENMDSIDFNKLLQDAFSHKEKDDISLMVEDFFKKPGSITLEELGKNLAEKIILTDINEQATLWSRVREEMSHNSLDSQDSILNYEKIAMGAMDSINTNEERDALIKGITGFVKYSSSNKIADMRKKFNPDSSTGNKLTK